MAREIRFIVLESDDLLFLMRDLATEKGSFTASHRQSVLVSEDSGGRPVATMIERMADGTECVLMRQEGRELAGMLIRFCRLRHIPLPKIGIKRPDLVEGNIALVIELKIVSQQSRSLAQEAASRPMARPFVACARPG